MIFSYTFTDTLISNCISSRNIFTFPMNVVNPPLAPATNHGLRCFAHRATDPNRCRVIIRNFETSVFATRSKDPLAESPRSTDEKMSFANQFLQNTSSASSARTHESLLRKHDTHPAVYLRITSATLSPEFSSRPGEPSRGEQTSWRIETMMRRISASPKIVSFRRYLLIFVKSSRPDNIFRSFNDK